MDLHYYSHYANGDIKIREPLTQGHESFGVVAAVGKDVKDLKEGTEWGWKLAFLVNHASIAKRATTTCALRCDSEAVLLRFPIFRALSKKE